MTMPALALVGASGRIQQSTESFRTHCGRTTELSEHLAELDAVLAGDADRAVARLDDVEARIEAVVDPTGVRCALLTLAVDPAAAPSGENAILREPLNDSPAIVWLKDLEGRHLRVNRQFISLLGGSEAELTGRTDAELPTAATVDGPRHQDPERAASEPVEFGYTVPAYQDRPALSVLRFLVHGADGEPLAVCGVAAPMSQSEIAENEAARLMQLNRWSRLDPEAVRSDVIEEWGVRFGDASESVSLDPGDQAAEWDIAPELVVEPQPMVTVEADPRLAAELAAATTARDEAMSARDEAVSARAALEERVHALEVQLEHARFAAEPGAPPADVDAAEAIAAARAETEEARASVEQARSEAEAARSVALTAHAETEAARAETEAAREAARDEVEAARADAEAARAQIVGVHDEIAALRAEAEAARTEAVAARTESASAWSEAETERNNADLFASQLADARRQLQHQRAQAALAQQQLQIPRCSAAAQASRPNQKGPRAELRVQIPLRARKPAAQPLDPTVTSQPAPVSVGGDSSHHEGLQRGGLLGKLRPRRRH
ncbi:MAG TPA: PAS domain-containing protein [Solirubrobacteraceae bacterium]|nr:PAS domain-containing protein [Solirubrobacteraceae bacterium]